MQAILVKYIGPSEKKGGRYRAKCQAGSVTVEHDHSVSFDKNAAKAAAALCKKLGWDRDYHGNLIMGGMPDGSYVFLMTGASDQYTTAGEFIKENAS